MELYTQTEIDKLLNLQTLKGNDLLTPEEITSAINNLSSNKPTTLDIIDAVAKVMKCTANELLVMRKFKGIIKPRHYVIYFAYYYTDATLYSICTDLSYSHHSSIIHAAHKIHSSLNYRDVAIDCALIEGELRDKGFKVVKDDDGSRAEKAKNAFIKLSSKVRVPGSGRMYPVYSIDSNGVRTDYPSVINAVTKCLLNYNELLMVLRRGEHSYGGFDWYFNGIHKKKIKLPLP